MSVPKEYNVIGGLIGLGPDIMLEILTEMLNKLDLQQLIGTLLSPLNSPCLQDLMIDFNVFYHRKENTNDCSIIFNPLICRGIVRLDILNIRDLIGVGIIDESICYGRNQSPSQSDWDKALGKILHNKDICRYQIESFSSNDRIGMELNMNYCPRTLTFFKNDIEQKIFITNLPASLRFWALLWKQGSTFKFPNFAYLLKPTAKHEESQICEW
ncbi:MAG: hypothetical protein EZS28_003751 [Streblomastix strix]|uniref:Uncharacterized protein n=1 Tax=Streblomastix strix TaxID=222440 RepID=A0A5J4X0L6_9EUKA|nr:MAG: hypothetical protein EZS28_003751 [Streblomastix strix]